MEQLTVNNDTQTVSARELHEKLNIGTQYTKWFERMCEYGFEVNEDYKAISQKRLTAQGNETTYIDHDISIDMAKQICMIQRTPEGKQCRQYLIDLEKAWNTPEQVIARALKMADDTINNLKVQLTDMKPKAEYFDALVDKKLNTNIRTTAKELQIKERAFVEFLLKRKYVFRNASGKLEPYAQYTESGKGLLTIKDCHNEKTSWKGVQTLVTPKGKETFRLLLESEDM